MEEHKNIQYPDTIAGNNKYLLKEQQFHQTSYLFIRYACVSEKTFHHRGH